MSIITSVKRVFHIVDAKRMSLPAAFSTKSDKAATQGELLLSVKSRMKFDEIFNRNYQLPLAQRGAVPRFELKDFIDPRNLTSFIPLNTAAIHLSNIRNELETLPEGRLKTDLFSELDRYDQHISTAHSAMLNECITHRTSGNAPESVARAERAERWLGTTYAEMMQEISDSKPMPLSTGLRESKAQPNPMQPAGCDASIDRLKMRMAGTYPSDSRSAHQDLLSSHTDSEGGDLTDSDSYLTDSEGESADEGVHAAPHRVQPKAAAASATYPIDLALAELDRRLAFEGLQDFALTTFEDDEPVVKPRPQISTLPHARARLDAMR